MEKNTLHPLTQAILELYKAEKIDLNDMATMLYELYGLDEDKIIEGDYGHGLSETIPSLILEYPYETNKQSLDDMTHDIKYLLNNTLKNILTEHAEGINERGKSHDIKQLAQKQEALFKKYDESCKEQEQILADMDAEIYEKKYIVRQLTQTVVKYQTLENNLVDGIQDKTGVDVALLELMDKIESKQTNT